MCCIIIVISFIWWFQIGHRVIRVVQESQVHNHSLLQNYLVATVLMHLGRVYKVYKIWGLKWIPPGWSQWRTIMVILQSVQKSIVDGTVHAVRAFVVDLGWVGGLEHAPTFLLDYKRKQSLLLKKTWLHYVPIEAYMFFLILCVVCPELCRWTPFQNCSKRWKGCAITARCVSSKENSK